MQNRVFKKTHYTWGGMKQILTKAIKKELGSNYFRALDDFLELKGYKNLKELLDAEKIVIIQVQKSKIEEFRETRKGNN